MFFGVVILVIGLAILLNALGILAGNFWGIFWGILFIAIGLKIMMKKEHMCPMCGMNFFGQKMHGKCCSHHNHQEEEKNN
jgi:hypothetical protein